MKYLSIIRYSLLGISALIMLVWLFFMKNESVDTMLYWCYALLGFAIILIIVLPLANMIKNPKDAMRSMIGLAIVLVVGFAAYSLGSTEPVVNSGGGFFDKPVELKLSDAGLYLTYLALAATIVMAVLGEIRNAFK